MTRARFLTVDGPITLSPSLWDRAEQETLGLHLRGYLDPARCAQWVSGVMAAKEHWNADFGGEQFSLGRAWYTHLEDDRAREYFANAAASDALVESFVPGLQATMCALLASLLGVAVRHRRGWCGPGVHIFPPDEHVARNGGVVHYDLEGLGEQQLRDEVWAMTAVAMLQPPTSGGGLRVWDCLWDGEDEPEGETLAAIPSVLLEYGVGDVLVFTSYRLHQIQPFGGNLPRISATAHSAAVDERVWEAWF